jgi:hypothetical protein
LKTTNPTQKKTYQASDIPSSLSRNPLGEEGEKVGLLSFLVKGLLLALEVHPIMRSRVKFSGDEKWLEVGRDGVVGVAVSGMSSRPCQHHGHGFNDRHHAVTLTQPIQYTYASKE